jgi:ParB/RepB/Spo0J family partition protein
MSEMPEKRDVLQMSDEAVTSDKSIKVTPLAVKSIYADPEFNCRGEITPIDVIDLAKSIARDGLQQPIKVRPRRTIDPQGYDYVIISGHRRHKAYQVLKHENIPCIIQEGLDEFKARTLNAIENLKRLDLNLLQEARTLSHFVKAGWNRQEIADEVGMSPAWVQIRTQLLNMPTEIQLAAAAGEINQNQVRDLYRYRNNPEKQLDLVRKLKEQRERYEDKKTEIVIKHNLPTRKKLRKRSEMFDLIETILNAYGPCLATRALAWAAGEITDLEVHESIKETCEKENLLYTMPEWEE